MAGTETCRIEELLARADWLRRLAASLRQDPDDLVQDTWLAALRSPPRSDRPAEPWLAAVLRNLARKRWRARQVRERALPSWQPQAGARAAAPDELLERAQLQRVIAELVLDLEEPYRGTLLRRYYEGQSSSEIAKDQGVPAGTVRWRLKMGLDQLRRRLDERHSGGRASWMALLSPLPELARAGGAAGASGLNGKGAFIMAMSTKGKLAAVGVLAAVLISVSGGVALWRQGGGSRDRPAASGGAARRVVIPALSGEAVGPSGEAIPAEVDAEGRDLLGTESETLEGKVLDEGGGVIPGARVHLLAGPPGGAGTGLAPTRSFRTVADGEGRYRIVVPPREYTVRAEADGYASTEMPAAITRPMRLDLRLHPAARIAGRVFERETGRPVPDAEVVIRPPGLEASVAVSTRAGDDGRFSFDSVAAGRYQISARRGPLLGVGPVLDLIATQTIPDVPVALDRGLAVSGRVRDGAGAGVPGLALGIGEARATSQADGRFRLEGISPGSQRLWVAASREGWQGLRREITVGAAGLEGVDLVVTRGGILDGHVWKASGKPAAGVTVRADLGATIGKMGSGDTLTAESGADGSFRLAGLPEGKSTVVASHPTFGLARQEVGPWEGAGTLQVDLHLRAGASVAGVVKFEDGSPAGAVSVAVSGQELGTNHVSVTTGDDGHFRAGGLLPGRYTVRARRKGGPQGYWSGTDLPELRIVTLAPDEQKDGLLLVLARGGMTIGGSVLLADGQPALGTQVLAEREVNGKVALKPSEHLVDNSATVGPDGRFRIEDVEAGAFTLWAVRPGFPEAQATHVAAGREDVKLALRAPASVAGTVTRREGGSPGLFSVNVVPTQSAGETVPQRQQRLYAHSFGWRPVRDPGGAFEWSGLAAGTYEIEARTPAGESAVQTVALADGERKQGLRLVVESAAKLTGTAVDLESGAPLPGLRVSARAGGRNVYTTTNRDGAFTLEGLIPNEEYLVELSAPDNRYVSEGRYLTIAAGVPSTDIGITRLLRGDVRQMTEVGGAVQLAVRNRDRRTSIFVLGSGSDGYRAGLRIGDVITAIDGRDVRAHGAGAIHYLLARPPGTTVSIMVQSPGQPPRTVSVLAESPSSTRRATTASRAR